MRLLLVNPNMTAAMTDRLARVARDVAMPGTEIVALTAPHGFPYISSRAEAQIAGAIALEMIAEALETPEPPDAVVIAAFGDPGLDAARELFDLPVVGMAEASMLTACTLGARFALVTFAPRMTPWYREVVARVGLEARCTGVRTPPEDLPDPVRAAETLRPALARLAAEAAAEGADVVILGGAPLAGLAFELAEALPAVALDPIAAAVTEAEALVRLAPRGASRGGFARPPGKASHGLAPALARRIAGSED